MPVTALRIIAIALCLFSSLTFGRQPPIILSDGPMEVALGHNMQWLKADYDTLSLAQLLMKQDSHFKPLTDQAVIEAQQTYWLRFHLVNPLNQMIPLALSLSSSRIHISGAYQFDQNENQWQRIANVKPEQQLSSNTGLILNIAANSDQWLYFRIRPNQTSRLEPRLQDLSSYATGFTFLQQILGAIAMLMIFISLLHVIAIRFHNHIRHYLAIYIAFIGLCYGLSHTQLFQWPQWFFEVARLGPWLMMCGVYLSCFTSKQYRMLFTSNRSAVIVLTLLLTSLIINNLPYLVILSLTAVLSVRVVSKIKTMSIMLSIANGVLLLSTLWQGAYILSPNMVFSADSIWHVYALAVCALFASLSIITPYFGRQIKRKKTQKVGIQSQFLDHLSHELRTPMNGVLGMSELLSDTPLSTNQRDYVDTIAFSGNEMLRMINRISDFSKIQSGRIQVEKKTVALWDLAQSCLRQFQHTANQKKLELVLNIDESIPHYIQCDERHVNNILDNLLENAMRNTEHGEIELRVNLQDNNTLLCFAVRDTGTGIHKHIVQQLLTGQINVKPNHSIEHVANKYGVGVNLCKTLVEHMGGHVFIESKIDRGSTFSFTLPYAPMPEQESETKENETEESGQILKGRSILIVDDNSTLRKVVSRYANSWGMQSTHTYSGKEALAHLRTQSNLHMPYDIILIDQDMPIMDGFQLAKRIKQDNDIDQSTIKIMLTGMSINSAHKEVVQYGIDQVITKPVSAYGLKQALSKHLAKQRHQRN